MNETALPNYATTHNHVIDWDNAQLIDRESLKNRYIYGKSFDSGGQGGINRDESSYDLTHAHHGVIQSGHH